MSVRTEHAPPAGGRPRLDAVLTAGLQRRQQSPAPEVPGQRPARTPAPLGAPLPPKWAKRLEIEVGNPTEVDGTPMQDVDVTLESCPEPETSNLHNRQVVYTVHPSKFKLGYEIAVRLPSGPAPGDAWPFAPPYYYIKTKKVQTNNSGWWEVGDWVDVKKYLNVITREEEVYGEYSEELRSDAYNFLHEKLANSGTSDGWSPAVQLSHYVSLLKNNKTTDLLLKMA